MVDSDSAYGSARFADIGELICAGLFRRGGLPVGFFEGRVIHHHLKSGLLVIGGAGSGKSTAILVPIILAGGRIIVLDVKGELAAIALDGLAHTGTSAWCINPYGLFGLPQHRVSLLGHLNASSAMLVGDSRRTCAALTGQDASGDNRFFQDKARFWLDGIMRGLVVERGGVSFASLADAIAMMRGDWDAWLTRAAHMAIHGPADLDAVFGEMVEMNKGEARTFNGVAGELTNALAFMADPALRNTFVDPDQADFSLDVLTSGGTDGGIVFLIMPPELLATNAALIRAVFSTMRTLKQRAPSSPPVVMAIDEAAALGPFGEIAELFSIGRGFNLTPVVFYQDHGQIRRNLGPTGAMTLSANAGMELYLGGGIRDLETATHLSRRLGNQTIALDERLIQERAQHAKRRGFRAVLFEGADPWQVGLELRQMEFEAQHVKRQARALMEPNEILALPPEQTLVLAGGYNLPPFLAEKRAYFTRRDLAGRFFPNPYVERDPSRIRVPGWFGTRHRRIIEEAAPHRFSHLPQYSGGRPLRYVQGYPPP